LANWVGFAHGNLLLIGYGYPWLQFILILSSIFCSVRLSNRRMEVSDDEWAMDSLPPKKPVPRRRSQQVDRHRIGQGPPCCGRGLTKGAGHINTVSCRSLVGKLIVESNSCNQVDFWAEHHLPWPQGSKSGARPLRSCRGSTTVLNADRCWFSLHLLGHSSVPSFFLNNTFLHCLHLFIFQPMFQRLVSSRQS
jgi:hypothetical protein